MRTRYVAVAQHAVMAVRGKGIERDVAQHAQLGMRLFHRAHGAADKVVRVHSLLAVGRLARLRGRREDRDEGDAEPLRLAGGVDQRGDGEPVDAGHGRHRRPRRALVMDEDRPDQVGGGEHVFRHQPPRPLVPPVAAQSHARISAKGWGRVSAHVIGLNVWQRCRRMIGLAIAGDNRTAKPVEAAKAVGHNRRLFRFVGLRGVRWAAAEPSCKSAGDGHGH